MAEEMKRELNGLKSDIGNLSIMARNTAKVLARLVGDIADMKRDMATKSDISTLMKRMYGFTDILESKRA